MPEVSIIVVCWNHLEDVTIPFLPEILKTEAVDYELIFVDNGCEDGTHEYLSDYFKDNNRVKCIKMEQNKGYAGGNNEGYKHATGKYICIMNNDIVIEDPLWLRKMLDNIATKQNTALCPELITDQPAAIWKDGYIHYMNGWCILISREFTDKYGLFHDAFVSPYLEDTEFSVRVKHWGWNFEEYKPGIKHLGGRSTFDQIDMYEEAHKSRDILLRLLTKLDENIPIDEYLMLK